MKSEISTVCAVLEGVLPFLFFLRGPVVGSLVENLVIGGKFKYSLIGQRRKE